MSKKPLTKKFIELDKKRIPLRQLLHGKEIREAAKALEDFRIKLNEQEFLYGAKITIKWENYGEAYAVARRLETDKEFEDRIEKVRLAAEAKAERERLRKLKEAKLREQEELNKKARVAEYIQKLAREAGIAVSIVE
jgi:hypothetical protein